MRKPTKKKPKKDKIDSKIFLLISQLKFSEVI